MTIEIFTTAFLDPVEEERLVGLNYPLFKNLSLDSPSPIRLGQTEVDLSILILANLGVLDA